MDEIETNDIVKIFQQFGIYRNSLSKQDGMKKKPTAGVAIFLHNFSNQYISKHMESKTNPSNNGLALFFHEDTGTLQLIDMKKIRTIHIEQSLKIGTPPRTSSEQRSLEGFNTSDETSSSSLQLNNISHSSKKSNQKIFHQNHCQMMDMTYKSAVLRSKGVRRNEE